MTEEIKKFYNYLGVGYDISLQDFKEYKKSKLIEFKKSKNKKDVAYFRCACSVVEKYIVATNCDNKNFFDLGVALNNILTLIIVLVAVVFAVAVILYKLS